jgi:aminoglycoside 3-N-acetyltransferase
MLRLAARQLQGQLRRAAAFQRRWWAPVIDEADIVSALRSLSAKPLRIVMVHSSLSVFGRVAGGASTVLRALRVWQPDATLAMPAHSYCYPQPGQAAPIFDARRSPSVVGRITDVFRQQPGVLRSLHPTHSLAVTGSDAEPLIRGHEQCDTPCGAGTPYARLVSRDAAVLMFGAPMHAYTLFHTAEDAAAVPYLYYPDRVSVRYRTQDGAIREMTMRRQDTTVARSFDSAGDWLQQNGLLHATQLGDGLLRFIPSARAAHQRLVDELARVPLFLTQSRS